MALEWIKSLWKPKEKPAAKEQVTLDVSPLRVAQKDIESDDRKYMPPAPPEDTAPANSQLGSVSSLRLNEHGISNGESTDGTSWGKGSIVLDDYVIQGILGEGGFGIVYLVQSRTTNERFAVKRARVSDPDSRAGFLSELQTWIGLPPHPNLAACRFFRSVNDEIVIFAEIVAGGSLAASIHNGKLYAGTPTQAMERILDIAIQFAWGLHAAHEMGLVHQDVKPDNVLMSAEGVAKVSDFGLSGGRTESEPVQAGAIPSHAFSVAGGTPAYLSPEQAQGISQVQSNIARDKRVRLTRQTDVWSWGVSVLEMFAGERTWRAGQIADSALEQLIETGPESARIPKIPNAVATVLRKALRQNQNERWPTLEEAAAQLRVAYLKNVGRAYPRPVPEFKRKSDLGQDKLSSVSSDSNWTDPYAWLESALKANGRDPAEARRKFPPVSGPKHAQAIRELAIFEAAKQLYEEASKKDQNHATAELASLCHNKGSVHEFLADMPGANSCYDRAILLRERLVNQGGRHDLANELANIYLAKASVLRTMGDMPNAGAICNKSIQIRERLVNKEGRRELSEGLARAYLNMGLIFTGTLDWRNAVVVYDKCIQIRERLVNRENRRDIANDLAWSYTNKAIAVGALGDLPGAVELYDKGIQIRENLIHKEGRREIANDLANGYSSKALAVADLGKWKLAVELYDKCIAILERLVNQEHRRELAMELAKAYLNKALAVSTLGDPRGAVELNDKCIQIEEKLVHQEGRREFADSLSLAYTNKANVLSTMGDPRKAVEFYDKSIQIRERLVNQEGRRDQSNHLAMSYMNKAKELTALGDVAGALKLHDKGIQIRERLVNQEGRKELANDLAWAYTGKAFDVTDQREKAELYQKAINIRERLINQDARTDLAFLLARSYVNKAIAYGSLENYREAIELLDKGVNIFDRLINREDRIDLVDEFSLAYLNKGVLINLTGDMRGAIKVFDDCVRVLEQLVKNKGRLEPRGPLAQVMAYRADLLHRIGETARAQIDARLAVSMLKEEIARTHIGALNGMLSRAEEILKRVGG